MTTKADLKVDITGRLITDLRQLIEAGELNPGDRLPPERELAKRFGASRASVRQAMKVLEHIGVISQRVGDGSYLNPDTTRILTVPVSFLIMLDRVSLFEMFEARLIMEPELAARAALCATEEDLASMRCTFNVMEKDTVPADVAFHSAVCKASGNRICHRMFGAIHHSFEAGMLLTAQLAPPGRALSFHKSIYSAIHMRLPEEARKAMLDHLMDAKNLLMKTCLDRGIDSADNVPALAGRTTNPSGSA